MIMVPIIVQLAVLIAFSEAFVPSAAGRFSLKLCPSCLRLDDSGKPLSSFVVAFFSTTDGQQQPTQTRKRVVKKRVSTRKKKKAPIWSYAWLLGKRRQQVVDLTKELQRNHVRDLGNNSNLQQWFDDGLEILVQWAKLGEGDICLDYCRELVDFGLESFKNDPSSKAQYYNQVVKAQRRVLNAYLNQAKRHGWNHETRRPMYKFSNKNDAKASAASLVSADKVLHQMETASRDYVTEATNVDGAIKRVPASILDGSDYHSLILGYCQLNQVVPALHALRRLESLYNSNNNLARLAPTVELYVSVMNAVMKGQSSKNVWYERTGIKYAPHEMVQLLFKNCLDFCKQSDTARPTIQLYNAVLVAWSKVLPPPTRQQQQQSSRQDFVDEKVLREKRESAESAKAVWKKLQNEESGVTPNAKTFTSLIYTYCKSEWFDDALDMAQQMVDMLLDQVTASNQAGKRLERVDSRALRMLVNGLARCVAELGMVSTSGDIGDNIVNGNEQALLRQRTKYAEDISSVIEAMWKLDSAGYYDVAPDVYLYTTAMNAWADTKSSLSSERAQALFDDLQQRYEQSEPRDSSLRPDVATYNALINAIAKQPNNVDAAKQAGAIVVEMEEMFKSGASTIQPDIITYNTLLSACLSSSCPEGMAKAEQTMKWMIKNGNPNPNARSYQSIIDAYCYNDQIRSIDKAEKWLDRMEERFSPPAKLYEKIILKWCEDPNPSSRGRARALLERMEELWKAQPMHEGKPRGEFLKPARHLYNAVIRAYQDQGNDAEGALQVKRQRDAIYPPGNANVESFRYSSNTEVFDLLDKLDDIIQSSSNPSQTRSSALPAGTTFNFNIILSKLAKSGKVWAGQRCDDVLNYMLELHLKRGNPAVRPTIVTFNSVMSAWAQSSHPEAGEKAVLVLEKLKELQKIGLLEEVLPDRITYNTIMAAFSKSDMANSAEMAEQYFRELEALYEETGDEKLMPDLVSYSTLLNAYANSREALSARRAEEILLEFNKMHKDDHARVKPNTTCFNEVLYAWAKSKDRNALKRAEMLLQLMEDMSERGDDDVRPNARTYNIVLLAAANSPKDKEAPLHSLLILDRMKESAHSKPDVVSYSTVIEAWSRAGGQASLTAIADLVQEAYATPGLQLDSIFFSGLISALTRTGAKGAAALAEQVVDEMKEKRKEGSLHVDLDRSILNALINCHAKSGEREAHTRAEEILRWMMDESANGNRLVTPDVQTWTSVIDAYAKSKDADACNRAESLLNEMDQVKPNIATYTAVIQSFARSEHADKAPRSVAILQRMKDDFEMEDSQDAQATIGAYNALLNSCEFTFGEVADVEEAFKIACMTFDEMRSNLKLDHVTYGTFLGVVAELMPKSDVRDQMVSLIFKRCCSDGQLGPVVLRKLKDAASPSLYNKLLNGSAESDLPSKWTHNVKDR